MSSPERLNDIQDKNPELSNSAAEQLEKLNSKENYIESDRDNNEIITAKARLEALDNSISVETASKESEKTKDTTAHSRRGKINNKQLDESYKKTMAQVQKELNPISRSFSKIIHNKSIEKISDGLGNTVARPNAILSGAFVAFILTLIVYIIAKTIGYQLSGFETIAAFILGWLIGLIYDYLRIIITGNKN